MEVRDISSALPAQFKEMQPSSANGEASFGGVIDRVLDSVTRPQHEADAAVQSLALGETDQLHQVLLSAAKADITFRLMLEVRNRLTEAYQEIQRMQI